MPNTGTKTVCEKDMCAGCMACVDSCGKNAISVVDSLEAYNAVIDMDRCVGCGRCERVCPQVSSPEAVTPISWHQGWARDPRVRSVSSSGGYAAAISSAFMRSGGLVCSCRQVGDEFLFMLTDDPEDLAAMQGSKYVKSNPRGAYKAVSKALRAGQKVLFIGLPCQVAAMRKYNERHAELLYTIDLICHGSPSSQVLKRFLAEKGKSLDDGLLDFRKDIQFQLRFRGAGSVCRDGVRDRYMIAFLSGLPYTEGCYHCRYARGERASDVTLGDSWGSELSEELTKGVSLALCQTDKGRELLDLADIEQFPVDRENAIANNGQLSHPSRKPKERVTFFAGAEKGKKLSELIFRIYPKQCIKYGVKNLLLMMRLVK